MARLKLKYVHADRDRHGNVRYYFFKRGAPKKLRLPGLPGTREFMAAYQAAFNGEPPPPTGADVTQPNCATASGDSLQWLCNAYCQSPEFKSYAAATQRNKRGTLRLVCAEPVSPGNSECFGDLPFRLMPTKALRALRDRKASAPQGANNWIAILRALFKWAVEAEHCEHNPAKDVPLLKVVSDGFHTWTIAEIRQFEAHYPIGSQARLAMALLAFTGQRGSDVVRLGPQHIRDGRFRFTQKKNETKNPVCLEIPLLSTLVQIINATPCGNLTYLINENGAAWSAAGFGHRFKTWCEQAGLPHCSAHGLRKAAACAAAEGGATEAQMMSIFGWRSPDMARLYARKANQRKMADDSMHLLDNRQNKDDTNVSHFETARFASGNKNSKKR